MLLLTATLFALTPLAPAQDKLLLEHGDTIVFLGDSITHAGFYVEPIESMLWCIHPELELEFFNAGVGGDVVADAAERLDAEVLAQEPDVVFVLLGMNDAGYTAFEPAGLERYRAGMDGLLARLVAESDATVVVLSPTFYDPAPAPDAGAQAIEGYNDTLLRYGLAGREVARAHGCSFVDVNEPMERVTRMMREHDAAATLVPDTVHPDERGGLVIADAVLQAVLPEVEPVLLKVPAPEGDGLESKLILSRRPVAIVPEATLQVAEAIGFTERWAAYALDPSALPEGLWRVTVGGGPAVEVRGGEDAEPKPVEVGVLLEQAKKLRELNDRRRRLLWADIRNEVWNVKSEADAAERASRYVKLHTETLALAWVKIRELERQIDELLEPVEVTMRVERVR